MDARTVGNRSWVFSSRWCRSLRRDLFVSVDCALLGLGVRAKKSVRVGHYRPTSFERFRRLFVLCVEGVLFLLHELGLWVH